MTMTILILFCFSYTQVYTQAEPPEDECLMNSKGDIILALKYVPSETSRQFSKKRKGTLMVKITEAKNLPVPRGSTLPDPYCKR